MFNIKPTQCLIIGSAILYELNIIKDDFIDDIDIVLLDPLLWEKFSRQYTISEVPYGKAVVIVLSFPNPWKIEFLNSIGPEKFNYMTKEGIVSNGINFITLENLIIYKKLFNRPKDHIHIELIENYLRKEGKRGTRRL
jgi:hypothetical protein